MSKEVIHGNSVPKPLGDYSQAWAVTGAKPSFVAGSLFGSSIKIHICQ